jgi:site-specific recombinase XerD
MQEREPASGEKIRTCIYSPHSERTTTATLLLDAGVAIESVRELLDHKHITITQIYDKRRRPAPDSVSHKVPI